ncbi:MAG: molecular chaperone TorD family protein [Coriobacteriales bacterium]|nr:molecular chaperone TorD family protein [Coriobacteriales bacterium]
MSTLSALEAEGAYLMALGTLLAASPEPEQLAQLAAGDVFSDVPFATGQPFTQKGAKMLAAWARRYDGSQLDALKYDYLCMFEGPGRPKAPPWESVYTNREKDLLFQAETLMVREWFKAYGLQVPNLYKEPDDHIAFEVQFVGHLTSQAAKMLSKGRGDEAQSLLAARSDFCAEHLLRWGFEWCMLAKEGAKTEYYLGLALLVEGMLATLRQRSEGKDGQY